MNYNFKETEQKEGEVVVDLKDRIIQKHGHVVEFSLNQIEENEKTYKKAIGEVEAQKIVEEAKAKNVENYHPEVLNISEEDLVKYHVYQEAKLNAKACQNKIDELTKDYEELKAEKADILKQLNINEESK